MLLTSVPFVLATLLLIVFPTQQIHIGSFDKLMEQSSELGFTGFLIQTSATIWIFTAPLWALTVLYVNTQKKSYNTDAIAWSFIGGLGHVFNLIRLFVF